MGLDIEAAFNKADTDHSGFIDLNEAQVFLKGIKAFDDAQIEALFKKYDADGNGLLDREEFALMAGELPEIAQ